jgi:DNA repair protein SbcD/Mre11
VRLLHTADWHVGKAIRGRSRLDELSGVLDEVLEIAQTEGVDAALLAGDVYDQLSAAPDADRLVLSTLVRFHRLGIPVVMIPGNHDSAKRFAAFREVLDAVGTKAVPYVVPPSKGGIVQVGSRDGAETALVACVPFVAERRFADAAALFDSTESWYQSYAEGMGHVMAAMAGGFREDAVNVVLAHLFTDGALLGGGEREVTIGMAYATSPSRLPGTASYVALGHMHRPQQVKGAPSPTRYAGSLLQLDFGEVHDTKSVCIVDVSPGTPAKVREVPITRGRRLLDVRGTLDEVLARAPDVGDAYLRVFVETDGPVPGIAERVRDALPNALDVHLVYEHDDETAHPAGGPVSAMAPREQFVAYYRAQHGAEPDDTVLEAFDEVLEREFEGIP